MDTEALITELIECHDVTGTGRVQTAVLVLLRDIRAELRALSASQAPAKVEAAPTPKAKPAPKRTPTAKAKPPAPAPKPAKKTPTRKRQPKARADG